MESNKITIDLEKFEGKSVLALKQEIQNQLSRIHIIYSAPNPNNQTRELSYNPYQSFNFGNDNKNSEIITRIELSNE